MSFRVTELQMLLGFAGKNKSGKKNELLARALDLLKTRSLTVSVQNKIKELHRQRYTNPFGGSTAHTSDRIDSSEMSSASTGPITRNSSALITGSNHLSFTSTHGSSSGKHLLHQTRSSDYYGSMPRNLGLEYPQKTFQNTPSPQTPQINYPIYPDVRFKHLPFYDMLGELLKPASLSKSIVIA